MKIVKKLKHVPIVKKIRKERWKRYARRSLLPSWKLKKIGINSQKDEAILKKHLIKNLEKAKEVEQEAQEILRIRKIECDNKKLICDILFWHFVYGFTVNEFFCYDFYDKSPEERYAYISDREIIMFGYEVNDIDEMQIFSDKMQTYEAYKKYYKRDAICICMKDDLSAFIEFIKQHPKFVKKEVREACGRSVELIDTTKLNIDEFLLFNSLISKGKTILEEPIIQGSEMNRLNFSSVNTIRCITLVKNNEIKIPYCFAKIGREGAFIDNGAAGGILVGIDCENGVFATDGIDEFGRKYVVHPDTGMKLKGFQVPEWKDMLEICKEMAEKKSSVKFIGWDMAYSNKGWVVVEGNNLSEAIGPQSTFGRGIKSDILQYLNVYGIPKTKIFSYMNQR